VFDHIADEHVAILGTLIAFDGRQSGFRGLAAGMLRVGTRAVPVQRDTPPLHPARIAGSHCGPPWGSWWLGVRHGCNRGGRRFSDDVKLPYPASVRNCRNSANRMREMSCVVWVVNKTSSEVLMETLPIHVFRESFGPIVQLLNEYHVRYSMQQTRSGVPMNSTQVIELLQSAALWSALAAVVVAFIKGRSSRKIIITTKENTVVHAEGLSVEELTEVLKQAKNLTAIETSKDET
jgi:hypothetical protein